MSDAGENNDQADAGAYSEDYFSSVYGTTGLTPLSQHWWSVRWYAKMAQTVLRRADGHRMLEIGCGQGFLLGRLESKYETWGLDLSPYAIRESARFAPGSRTFVADIQNGLPEELEPRSFDLIVARYVFEHLADPLAAMQCLTTLLRPGGTLFYAVPYTDSFGAHRKGMDWYASTKSDPTHCSLLSRERWLELTDQAGLTVTNESADGWWDLPYMHWLPMWLQKPLFLGPTIVACLTGRALLPPRWGENVLVFARKSKTA